MFNALEEKTLYIFAACNAITIPMVWALYPESNQRTLEEMNLLFASDSIWNWEAEKNFKLLKEQNPGLVGAAKNGVDVVGRMEDGRGGIRSGSIARGMSLDAGALSAGNTKSHGEEVEKI